MHEARVRRFIFVSSYLLEAKHPRIFASVARWIYRHELAELDKAERLIQECNLDWSIFRPAQLNNNPPTGKVRIQEQRNRFASGPYHISRADLAAALVDSLNHDTNHRRVFCITSSKK